MHTNMETANWGAVGKLMNNVFCCSCCDTELTVVFLHHSHTLQTRTSWAFSVDLKEFLFPYFCKYLESWAKLILKIIKLSNVIKYDRIIYSFIHSAL